MVGATEFTIVNALGVPGVFAGLAGFFVGFVAKFGAGDGDAEFTVVGIIRDVFFVIGRVFFCVVIFHDGCGYILT